MRRSLLLTGAVATLLAVAAPASASGTDLTPVSKEVSRITVNNPIPQNRELRKLAPGVSISIVNGRKHLNMPNSAVDNKISDRAVLRAPKASVPEGYVLFESFEGWDGEDVEWVPDGWTVEQKGKVELDESWIPYKPGEYDLPVPDGKYGFKVTWGSDEQDEWLISPYVEVPDGMDLSYWVALYPMWLYVIDDHVDWSTGEWIGEREVAATLQIWVQPEGSDWVMLKDYFDQYKDYTFEELQMIYHEGTDVVSLKDYYGKKIRVAFRYVGYDGDETFIDAVAIGYPKLENVSYLRPGATQFWGLERSPDMVALSTSIAAYPVYYPTVWTNNNPQENVAYTWSYADPETGEIVSTTDNPENLEVTYHPDYSNEETIKNNLFPTPVLRAEADHAVPVEYQAPFAMIQAGGAAEYATGNTDYRFTTLPFNLQDLDLSVTTVNDSKVGDMAIPVFGYNGANTDQYWLNYSLNGAPEFEGDFSHLIAIGNLYYPENDAPLVVHGGNVYGFGQISDNAQLTMSIRAISEETHDAGYDVMEVVASKTISGADIIRQDPQKSYMCLPFDFDEPVVLQKSDDVWAYMIMFEGFHSEHVSYFAPLQNLNEESEDYPCLGYIFNYIDLSRQIGRPPYYSTKTMRYSEDNDIKLFNGAFAIGLYSEYPWLTADKESVALPDDGSVVEVGLGSYYDGADLKVEAPEGVVATVAGRYDKCVLSLSRAEGASNVSGNVVVKGPGVEVKVAIDDSAAISSIAADNAAVKAIYDIAGRRIAAGKVTPGIYVVKYNDGNTRKLIVK